MPTSNALAVETRAVVTAFLTKWADAKVLTYKFSVHAETSSQNRHKVQVVFSKPTPEMPAPAAVAHFCFVLDETLQRVQGFTVESDPHFHALDEIHFDERVIDQVIKRKLLLKQQNLVNLNDEFSSTRVPAAIKAREDEHRARERENLEEYLLETFLRRDPYNDSRIAITDFRDAVYSLELPARVGHQQRQILFAFAEQDRDEMVDYAMFVPIAADVIDTLAHSKAYRESKASAKDDDDDESDNRTSEQAEEAYQVLAVREIDYTLQRLNKLLQSHEPQLLTTVELTDEVAETSIATAPPSGADDEQRADTDSELDAQDQESTCDEPDDDTSRGKPIAYTTTRQLRAALESPQIVVSKREINLILGLVDVSPSGEIALTQLGELYPRVRSLLFEYQCQCFDEQLDAYLLQQFQSFESGSLCGSAKHLRGKLRQKDVHTVVMDMKKLVLTPCQQMRVRAIIGSEHLNDVVDYKTLVPQIAHTLQMQVDLDNVIDNAAALRCAQDDAAAEGGTCANVFVVPSEDTLKRSSLECFEQRDPHRVGVLSTDDFIASLCAISTAFDMDLDAATELQQLYAIADPSATGRVNYLVFLQCMFPLLRVVQQERLLVYGKQRLQQRGRAERKEAK